MIFSETDLAGAYIVDLEPYRDDRGFFARTYCQSEFEQIGHNKPFVQINHSCTVQKGTIRGMHYQLFPNAEIKLIRCISGEVYDVIVDIRKGSPTFLKFFGVILSPENMRMIYVPEGFAHGFQTLKEDTQLLYHHTAFYSPQDERGLHFKDPVIGIDWPIEAANISSRDRQQTFIDNSFTGI